MSDQNVQRIANAVCSGQMTPELGALLLDLNRRIQRKRRPWWRKAASFIARLVFG